VRLLEEEAGAVGDAARIKPGSGVSGGTYGMPPFIPMESIDVSMLTSWLGVEERRDRHRFIDPMRESRGTFRGGDDDIKKVAFVGEVAPFARASYGEGDL
jgi:hypothetical protein